MNQRDRIALAMLGPDGVPGSYGAADDETPQGLETGGIYGGPGLPPPAPRRHPRNLLRGDQGISQELIDEMLRKEGHGTGGGDPEMQRIIEQAINGPREYNEWDTVPAKNPRVGEWPTEPPLPPTVIPPDAPDWATTQQGSPEFMEYPTIRGKYTDT